MLKIKIKSKVTQPKPGMKFKTEGSFGDVYTIEHIRSGVIHVLLVVQHH